MAVRTLLAIALVWLLVPSAAALAEGEGAATMSFDDLLEQVRAGWRQERESNRQREREFLAAKQDQKRLLDEATATRLREERRSEQLEARFEAMELEITQLEERLAERMGNLGELFGVVRQVAGDTRGQLEESLVSAQIPGRAETLGKLAESRTLPSVEQLEGLWYALLEEAVQQGRVVRFPAPVIQSGGAEAERQVVRIGVFNAVSNGAYLNWDGATGRLAELGRQPAPQYVSTVAKLERATEGTVRAAVDPSRGSILRLLVQTPSFRERISFGGVVGYAIIVLGAITVLVAIARGALVWLVSRKVARQKKSDTASDDNPLGRILKVGDANVGADVETLELKLDEAILRESNRLERFLWAIKVVSVVAPLMGLLGTVTGMINTFQAIMLFGTGDPKMMAGGISEALVTTMLGLYAAIPLVLLHSWVSSMSRGVVEVLDEQSAGLVARRAEGRAP